MDASSWDERYAADGLLWTAQPNRFFVAEVVDLPPGRALDMACGEGRNAVWLATKGWHVTAVDHSEVGLAKGRELALEAGVEVDWHLGDVTTYDPAPGFDLAAVLYLHLPRDQMRTAIETAVRVLDPGGLLVVVGHHPDNIAKGVGGPQVPEVLYLPEDIAQMLGGMEMVKADTVERPVDRAGVTGIAIDTLVTAVRT